MSGQSDLLNRIANQPEVRQNIAPGYEAIDLSLFFNSPANVMIGDERGVVLFAPIKPGLYEMHYLMTNSTRGPAALRAIKAAIRALFTYYPAYAITGSTPRDNFAARAVNRALGGRPIGVSTDTSGRCCIDYVLERATWVRLSGA
jgi:hypothetical protein